MAYQLRDRDPDPEEEVRFLTFVPFLPDGCCAAVPEPAGGLALPSGAVQPGEHWLLDTCRRVPLETAGIKMQRVHVFATDRDHVYAWLDGDRYTGWRPHATVALVTGHPAEVAEQLAAAGRPDQAQAVRDAARSVTGQSDQDYYTDNVRLLEPAYLRGGTVEAGSGFGGDPARWRARREMIVDGIDRDGSFLDLGCANGLLMESVRQWAAERGYRIEPYGVDLAPGLVALARSRLPHWADRIEVGNAIDYRPAGRCRFTYAHALLDLVPDRRRGDLLRRALAELVEPGGRLLVSHYQGDGGTDRTAAEHLHALGLPVTGQSRARDGSGSATTAWLTA